MAINMQRIMTTVRMPDMMTPIRLLIEEINRELEAIKNPVVNLKVKRTEDAKQFPLLHFKKEGDVGLDLTAIFPYKKGFEDAKVRQEMIDRFTADGVPREIIDRDMRESAMVHPGGRTVIPTGIFLEIPVGYWAAIEARSSTSKDLVIVPKGVIDNGYRGELFCVAINVGNNTTPVEIKHGDRITQLIIQKRENVVVEEVDELSDSERGDTGFGSTGETSLEALKLECNSCCSDDCDDCPNDK